MRKIVILISIIVLLITAATILFLPPRMPEGTIFAWQGDVAFLEQGGRLGLVNRRGKVLLEPMLTGGGLFDENGLAPVKHPGGCALLKKDGTFLHDMPGYHSYALLHEDAGLYEARGYDSSGRPCSLLVSAEHGVLTDGRFIYTREGTLFLHSEEGWYAAAPDGKPLQEPFPADEIWQGENGLIVFAQGNERSFMTVGGDIVYVTSRRDERLLRYLDPASGTMTDCPWPDAWMREPEHIFFRENGHMGLARRDTGVVLEAEWDSIDVLLSGDFLVERDGQSSIYHADGTLLKSLEGWHGVYQDHGYREDVGVLIGFSSDDPASWQVLSLTGEPLAKPETPCVAYGGDQPRLQGEMFRISTENGDGWMDLSGRVHINPAWNNINEFLGGMGTVRVDGSLVFVNGEGKEQFRVTGLLHPYTNQTREVDGRRYYNLIGDYPSENRFLTTWIDEEGHLVYPPS